MQIQKKCFLSVYPWSCWHPAVAMFEADTGRVYMPDMAYSRAYETYALTPEEKEIY